MPSKHACTRETVLALQHFLPRLSGQHVLVRTDNTVTWGGVRSQSLHHWATRLLLWAARHVLSLRAVHIPGHLNYGADLLSRGDPRAADWCLHPQVIEQIWIFQGAGGPVRKQAEYLLPALVLARGRRSPTRHRRAGPPPERCRLIASGLSDAVVATIQSARAVSRRALYTLK